MTNTAKHTPTPWEIVEHTAINDVKEYRVFSGYDEIAVCRNTVGGIVAVTQLPVEANAAFICRAVNCHDELLDVLVRVMNEIEHGGASGTALRAMTEDAHAAIAKARGKR